MPKDVPRPVSALETTQSQRTTVPSFAELKLVEALEQQLIPAMNHVGNAFGSPLLGSTLLVILQTVAHQLYGASMAETICGYSRGDGTVDPAPSEMSPLQRKLSLLSTLLPLVLVPTQSMRGARLLLGLWRLGDVATQFSYLLGATESWQPLLAMGSVVIRRRVSSMVSGTQARLGAAAGVLLLALVVAARASAQLWQTDAAPHVEAPPFPHSAVVEVAHTRDCPLCGAVSRDPCASTSGRIFCFTCLTRALENVPRCPVSGLPCSKSDVIRIFEH